MACPEQRPRRGRNPTQARFKVGQRQHNPSTAMHCSDINTPQRILLEPTFELVKDTLYRPVSSLPKTQPTGRHACFRFQNPILDGIEPIYYDNGNGTFFFAKDACAFHFLKQPTRSPNQARAFERGVTLSTSLCELPCLVQISTLKNKKVLLQGNRNNLGHVSKSCSTHNLSLLIVGKPVCLVMLCLISARRDKVCPQYRVRN
jgi:hypothetical protein